MFMVGGTTYGEAHAISEVNRESGNSARVLLGGTCVHIGTLTLEQVPRANALHVMESGRKFVQHEQQGEDTVDGEGGGLGSILRLGGIALSPGCARTTGG